MPEAVIVSAARSPIGRANKGSLVDLRPDDMSATIIKAALDQAPGLDPDTVEDVIWGCGQPAGEAGYNIARVTAGLAGMAEVPGVTVNRYCSSSLQTIRMAAHAIKAGEGDAFVAGGVETVSRYGNGMADGFPNSDNPIMFEPRKRSDSFAENNDTWAPGEGLADYYIAMGHTAENVASYKGVSREAQDEFAALSQQRAEAAINRGFFEREITPLEVPIRDEDGNLTGETRTVSTDDGPRAGTTVEKLAGLNPVFRPNGGTVTAGNACPLNDGAAATVVMSDTRAAELGLKPLARIISSAVTGLNPEIMGLGPVEACKMAMARAGMSIGDIDLVEINEAFAAQVVPSANELGIDIENQLNVNGGAIALGHPFGMTGARIMATLLNGLQDADKTIGMESMCVGGGQGMAMIVERLN